MKRVSKASRTSALLLRRPEDGKPSSFPVPCSRNSNPVTIRRTYKARGVQALRSIRLPLPSLGRHSHTYRAIPDQRQGNEIARSGSCRVRSQLVAIRRRIRLRSFPTVTQHSWTRLHADLVELNGRRRALTNNVISWKPSPNGLVDPQRVSRSVETQKALRCYPLDGTRPGTP